MFTSPISRILAVSSLALALGACATQPQQYTAAPVVASTEAGNSALYNTGYNTGVYNPYSPTATTTTPVVSDTGAYNNPYGTTTPYTPVNTATAVYHPPVAPVKPAPSAVNALGQLVGNVNGVYIGNYAQVDINATTHKVSAGDTVFNIAKRYGISQDNLRAWNNLPDNTISVGQVLRVKGVGASTPAYIPAQPTPAKAASTITNTGVKGSAVANVRSSSIVWTAPTQGVVVRSFGGDNKGVDISGTRGQPIVSAADGQVVYSGSGLRGYGNLVIVQHNPTYLTAYGHNDSLMVQEGQMVKRGQQIARMGSSDSSSGVKLHFEVRENGTPINPGRFVKF